jgi:hypothetical protein
MDGHDSATAGPSPFEGHAARGHLRVTEKRGCPLELWRKAGLEGSAVRCDILTVQPDGLTAQDRGDAGGLTCLDGGVAQMVRAAES